MKSFTSIIYIICVVLVCALVVSLGIWLYKNYGNEILGDVSQSHSSSVTDSGSSTGKNSSGQNSSSTITSNGSQTGSQSSFSGGSQTPSPNYTLQEYSFDLADGYNPLENYTSTYAIVIPINQFSPDLPDEGYKTYTVSEGEDVDDYLGDVAPLLYYEIKYEYGWEYYTKIILIPKSAFTITGGQFFVTNAIPDTVFNENFYENVYSDGTFISIKIISRDQYFIFSDWGATHGG